MGAVLLDLVWRTTMGDGDLDRQPVSPECHKDVWDQGVVRAIFYNRTVEGNEAGLPKFTRFKVVLRDFWRHFDLPALSDQFLSEVVNACLWTGRTTGRGGVREVVNLHGPLASDHGVFASRANTIAGPAAHRLGHMDDLAIGVPSVCHLSRIFG
jgi:hypothetical protein